MRTISKTTPGRGRSDESGSALLEFALVLPLMLTLLMGGYEFGVAAERYLALSRVAYEMGRYGASIPGLEEGSYPDENEAVPINQNLIWLRYNQLLLHYSLEGPAIMTSEFTTGGTPVLEINVAYEHEPIFPILEFVGLATIPMNLTVRSPYLGRVETVGTP